MTVILEHLEQGTVEWLSARLGCITMSNAKKLITKGRGSKPSETRKTYIIDVAAEILSGMPAESINTWAMERGNILEPFARQAYEVMTGRIVRQVGLGYLNEDRRVSASPDGLTSAGGMEIKCQGAKAHVRTILDGNNPDQFSAQIQGCMWVFNVDQWDYCSFCPEVEAQPLFIATVHRDQEIIKRIEESAINAVEEVDAILRTIGSSSKPISAIGTICDEAIALIDVMKNEEPEFY